MNMWSPLKLNMLLHFLCAAEPFPSVHAPAQQQIVQEFRDAGLIKTAEWGYQTTTRGATLAGWILAAASGMAAHAGHAVP